MKVPVFEDVNIETEEEETGEETNEGKVSGRDQAEEHTCFCLLMIRKMFLFVCFSFLTRFFLNLLLKT